MSSVCVVPSWANKSYWEAVRVTKIVLKEITLAFKNAPSETSNVSYSNGAKNRLSKDNPEEPAPPYSVATEWAIVEPK